MPTVAGEMVASFGSKVNPFSKGDFRPRGLFSHFNLLLNPLLPSSKEDLKQIIVKDTSSLGIIQRSRTVYVIYGEDRHTDVTSSSLTAGAKRVTRWVKDCSTYFWHFQCHVVFPLCFVLFLPVEIQGRFST